MIDERQEENASLYALDLLEGEERRAFEAELARNSELKKLVDDLRQASSQVALTAPQIAPSAKLRARVLASIDSRPQSAAIEAQSAPSNAGQAQIVRFPLTAWVGWAVAACFAIFSGYVSVRYLSIRKETTIERDHAQLAAITIRTLEQELEAQRILATQQISDLRAAGDLAQLKIAKLASLNNNSAEAVAIAVWNPLKQEGVLTVENLPLIQKDQDYQLWIIDPRYANPVNGGIFNVDARGTAHFNFRPDQPVTAATKFAISRERKGGVPKAEGPLVAAGAL